MKFIAVCMMFVPFGLLSFALPAQAQPRGIAFVEAPEQSAGRCLDDNMARAFACARAQCTANGTQVSDCYRVKWCYPARWSADLFVQHSAGNHWHEYLCGWGSKEDLIAAANVRCAGSRRDDLIECSIVGAWNPNGDDIEID